MISKNFQRNSFSIEPFSVFFRSALFKKYTLALLIVCVGVLSVFIAYRQVFLNSLSELSGDRYDMVIMSSILEHWKNFWSGNASWHEVGYFYPYTRTIAQTDGYFLTGIIYSIIRVFFDDIYISVFLTTVTLSVIGFSSFYLLSRSVFGFRVETSLLTACVFVLLNSLVSHSQRLQLMSVYFLPILSVFLIYYLKGVSQRNLKLSIFVNGCFFGVLYGALTITCFYIAWFFALFLLVTLITFSLFKPKMMFEFAKSLAALKWSSCIVLIVFFVSLIPFVWAYYPKSLEVGVRNYSSASGNLLLPLELIQVGFDNYLYGNVLSRLFNFVHPGYKPWGEYYNVGFSPLIFGLFVASIFYFKKKKDFYKGGLFILIGLSTLICCILVIKVGDFSLWFYVYSFVPGAKALNAVSVFLMVLALPVLIVVGKYLDSQKLTGSFFAVLSILIIVGELTTPYVNFDRKLENSRIANIPTIPSTCHVFYVSELKDQKTIPGFPEWVNSMYAHNVTAMIISQMIKIPTINGIASFNPPDWNFAAPWDQGYDQRMLTYAQKHGVHDLCKLDLNEKSWAQINN